MGVREDVSAWIAYYIVKPAIDAFRRHATTIEKTWALVIGLKFQLFLRWVGGLNTSVSAWVNKQIEDAIDSIEGGEWDFFKWIVAIIDAVLDAITDIFVRVKDFIVDVQNIVADWWISAKDTLLRTLKDTFVSIVDFGTSVITKVIEAGYETASVILKTVGGLISTAIDVVSDVVDSVIKNVSGILNTIADYLLPAISNIWDSITDLVVDIAEDIAGTVRDMRDLVTDSIIDMIKYVDDTIPEVVSSMFEWAKPIKDPIINAADDLDVITTALTEKTPTDPEWKRVMEENAAILAEVKKKLEGF